MDRQLRIAFFGTPDFAVASLKKIVEDHWNVVVVITAPDKPSGRGQQMQASEVKKYALENNLSIQQPEKLKSKDFVDYFQSLQIDLAVVVAFRMLPECIWAAPKLGTINLHASLLPNYRGAAPINWAIIHGDTETGVTTFFINQDIDKGDILFQEKCAIEPADDFGTLYNKLKAIGANLLVDTLHSIEQGTYTSVHQVPQSTDKLAPKIQKDVLEIKDYSSCVGIDNLVRGLNPVYKPYFTYKDKKYIVRKGHYTLTKDVDHQGELQTDNATYLKLACLDGFYWVSEIQPEGKKAMDMKQFFNGNTL